MAVRATGTGTAAVWRTRSGSLRPAVRRCQTTDDDRSHRRTGNSRSSQVRGVHLLLQRLPIGANPTQARSRHCILGRRQVAPQIISPVADSICY